MNLHCTPDYNYSGYFYECEYYMSFDCAVSCLWTLLNIDHDYLGQFKRDMEVYRYKFNH